MECQIRPLHYWRERDNTGDTHRPVYGDQCYHSDDRNWMFTREVDGWKIDAIAGYPTPASIQLHPTGLFDVRFERLRDAIDALEQTLEGIE